MICWAWMNGRLPVDLDLMLAKRQGDLDALWAAAHPGDVARVAGCAGTLGWSPNWTRQVSVAGLALHAGGKTLGELTDGDITASTEALAAAPSLTATLRGHNTARVFGLHHACTSWGSATPRRGWRAGPPPPSRSCAPRVSRNRRSVGSRCAISRRSRPRCARAPWRCARTA
jgi:hypothetical protein